MSIEALPKEFFWNNYVCEILVEKWLPPHPTIAYEFIINIT